jgi:methionyl-tRNA formyltransferase
VSWSYPRKIAAQTVAAAHIGALNMHMALLPRHRGLDPIFWTYWHDDRDAGVTIHWMNERFDSGDVISQEAVPLERGLASRELYDRIAPRSLGLMTSALAAIAAGTAARQPQDESRATFESAADTRRVRVPLAEWPAERVWHVLSGLGDMRSGLVSDAVDHGRATRYHLTANVEPGRVVAVAGGYDLHCRDGIVALSRRN